MEFNGFSKMRRVFFLTFSCVCVCECACFIEKHTQTQAQRERLWMILVCHIFRETSCCACLKVLTDLSSLSSFLTVTHTYILCFKWFQSGNSSDFSRFDVPSHVQIFRRGLKDVQCMPNLRERHSSQIYYKNNSVEYIVKQKE